MSVVSIWRICRAIISSLQFVVVLEGVEDGAGEEDGAIDTRPVGSVSSVLKESRRTVRLVIQGTLTIVCKWHH